MFFQGNEGSAPKEGREEVRRVDNAAAGGEGFARAKGDPYPRYRKHLDSQPMTEDEKEKAAKFSMVGHALTFNEIEFMIIVIILLIFVVSLLWQMYTGRYQLPSILRMWNKRPGGRYNN